MYMHIIYVKPAGGSSNHKLGREMWYIGDKS
jgi:hypothetical protein